MDNNRTTEKIIGGIIAVLMGIAIFSQVIQGSQNPSTTPSPTPSIISATATKALTPVPSNTPSKVKFTQPPTLSPTPEFTRPIPGSVCPYDPVIAKLFDRLPQETWASWIEKLSGETPLPLGGKMVTIETRFTESLFRDDPKAQATEFILSQLRQWGYEDGLTLFEHEYTPFTGSPTSAWKNIIALIPGVDPELSKEIILLTAHLDSITFTEPEEHAPGADDNATGAATLLEAARVLRGLEFKRTIQLIFFTGEEQGLLGSQNYISDHRNELENVLGVFNLDMFGYDADNDRCFEIHVGGLKASNLIGGCLADTVDAYAESLNLKYEYLVPQAMGFSDHASFWQAKVGAILVVENFSTHRFDQGCGEEDRNPNYHTVNDLIAEINLSTGHAIASASIAAVARLAEPMEN